MFHCLWATRSYKRSLSPRITKGYACAIFLILPTLSSGCVALNIPSVRYDDPADRGGLFGPQKTTHPEELEMMRSCTSSSGCSGYAADEELELEEEETPPEVPWPRFHPLPTRPVFATPAG